MIPSSAITSNPITFLVQAVNPGALIFHNTRAGTCFVVTFISLINESSNSGDACLIQDVNNAVAVHSGVVGTGSFDRFPLNCEISIPVGNGLSASATVGTWSVAVTGHYVPLVLGT